jgi:hypothetical protein
MPASDAQIQANRRNALLSTGPKTPEGKEQSRQNALKHGLTGDGVVVPAEDAEEVQRRFIAFRKELQPSTEVGLTLVRRAATLAVRMEKCAERDLAAMEKRVVEAMSEVEEPEDGDPAEWARLQSEAGRLAAFDPSKEACLARRYEAAAERGFYRALKEFRLVEKSEKSIDPDRKEAIFRNELASFLDLSKLDAEFDAEYPEMALPLIKSHLDESFFEARTGSNRPVDVPITIGRAR